MIKEKRNALIISLVAVAVFAGLFIVATFYDLQVSKFLASLKPGYYYSGNIFARIFETIGECPIYIVTAFSCAVIFWNFKKRKRSALTITMCVFALLICFVMLFYMFYKIFKYLSVFFDFADKIGGVFDYLGYAALAGIFSFLLIYFTRKLSVEFLNSMLCWAFIVLLTALLSQIIVQVIKNLAGRPRYRTMNALEDFTIYRKWFEFQGKKSPTQGMIIAGVASDGFRSFPSGHSASAAMLISITSIPCFFKRFNTTKCKVTLWSTAVIFTVLTMISRIVMGAHFLSDVLFGMGATVLSFYFASYILKLLFKKVIKIDVITEKTGIHLEEEEG